MQIKTQLLCKRKSLLYVKNLLLEQNFELFGGKRIKIVEFFCAFIFVFLRTIEANIREKTFWKGVIQLHINAIGAAILIAFHLQYLLYNVVIILQCLKLDELVEQERQVRLAMTNRAGVLGLMLHSTYDHEYAQKVAKRHQTTTTVSNKPSNNNELSDHHYHRVNKSSSYGGSVLSNTASSNSMSSKLTSNNVNSSRNQTHVAHHDHGYFSSKTTRDDHDHIYFSNKKMK